jgi:hypothetical protein
VSLRIHSKEAISKINENTTKNGKDAKGIPKRVWEKHHGRKIVQFVPI